MKCHLAISAEPLTEGQTHIALCGSEIRKAKFEAWVVLNPGHSVNWNEFLNTLTFCAKCRRAIVEQEQDANGKRYIYSIREGQEDDSTL